MSAALLPLLAVATLSDVETAHVVDTFRQVCIEGKAQFKRDQIREVALKSMASDARWYFSDVNGPKFSNVKFYELKLSKPAYLAVWKHKPVSDYYTEGCAVIARGLPYIGAWEKVLRVQFPSRDRARLLETEARRGRNEFPLPEEGKKLLLNRVGQSVVLQVAAMSDSETREWKGSSAIRRSPITESPKP